MLQNHVFHFENSRMFGAGNYEFHAPQTQFSSMLCIHDLCLLQHNIEFGVHGTHIEFSNFLTPTLAKHSFHMLSRLNASFKVTLLRLPFK